MPLYKFKKSIPMEKIYLQTLLKKHLENSLSFQERLELDAWYNSYARYGEPLRNEMVYQTVVKEMDKAFPFVEIKPVKKIKLWQKIASAAAILTVIAGGLIYYNQKQDHIQSTSNYANDVAPGKMGATLTLADGKKILITDASAGVIGNQAGVRISKTADGKIVYEITDNNTSGSEYNTLSTVNGQQTEVRLPDGSLVFLNAASSIKYPASFARLKERRIELSGEAYFEVAKDKAHPFIVLSNNQAVRVLGTKFNINAYGDNDVTRTTLLEGSVELSANKDLQKSRLSPGQVALLKSGKVTVQQADAELEMAWKLGFFSFQSAPLENVMQQISRWYDVDIYYPDPQLKGILFSGTVSRYDNISGLLRAIEKTGVVKFKIEGRTITVL
jgi:transmembrane sensor